MFISQRLDFVRAVKAGLPGLAGAQVRSRGCTRFDVLLARGTARFDRRATLLMAALSAASMSCALQVHEGDGLVTDGREVQISPIVTPDAGRADAGVAAAADQECKQLALFEQSVMPLLLKKCEALPVAGMPAAEPQGCIDCHDGTKPKAFVALPMDATETSFTCLIALVLGTKMEGGDSQPQILTSSDANRPDKVHDFKFKNADDYNHLHDAIVAWLSAEKQ